MTSARTTKLARTIPTIAHLEIIVEICWTYQCMNDLVDRCVLKTMSDSSDNTIVQEKVRILIRHGNQLDSKRCCETIGWTAECGNSYKKSVESSKSMMLFASSINNREYVQSCIES